MRAHDNHAGDDRRPHRPALYGRRPGARIHRVRTRRCAPFIWRPIPQSPHLSHLLLFARSAPSQPRTTLHTLGHGRDASLVLQSIYGEDALKIWRPSSRSGSQFPDRGGQVANAAEPGTIRYELTLGYVAHESCGSMQCISSLLFQHRRSRRRRLLTSDHHPRFSPPDIPGLRTASAPASIALHRAVRCRRASVWNSAADVYLAGGGRMDSRERVRLRWSRVGEGALYGVVERTHEREEGGRSAQGGRED